MVWAKVSKFSDLVWEALREAAVDFAGLICPPASRRGGFSEASNYGLLCLAEVLWRELRGYGEGLAPAKADSARSPMCHWQC